MDVIVIFGYFTSKFSFERIDMIKENLHTTIDSQVYRYLRDENSKAYHYNSITDFATVIYKNTRTCDSYTIHKHIKGMIDEGIIYFDENTHSFGQLEWIEDTFDDYDVKRLPTYILDTHQLPEKYRLDYFDFRLMLYCLRFNKQVRSFYDEATYKAKQRAKRGIVPQLMFECIAYPNSKRIADKLSVNRNKVIMSLRRLRIYFGDKFWYRPTSDEKIWRYHMRTYTNTLNIPPRNEWKSIIERRTKEIAQELGIELKKMTVDPIDDQTYVRWKALKEKELSSGLPEWRCTKLLAFARNVKEEDRKRREKLLEGNARWDEKRQEFNHYLDFFYQEAEAILRGDGLDCMFTESQLIDIDRLLQKIDPHLRHDKRWLDMFLCVIEENKHLYLQDFRRAISVVLN